MRGGPAIAIALGVAALGLVSFPARSDPPASLVLWQERFDAPLRWVDPAHHGASEVARVYAVHKEGALSFLHARHDATTPAPPKAVHYGMPFADPIPLEKVGALTWRWRVQRHPQVGRDAWEDLAASVYVVMRTPSLVVSGRGFKLGWLAAPGRAGTRQHGLAQIELRHDPAGGDWVTESVDLCALFRREYGRCEGEHVLYVGVMTDADGGRSVAEADYADLELVGR